MFSRLHQVISFILNLIPLLLLVPFQQIQSDVRLSKSADFDAPLIPIKKFMELASEKSDVPISVSQNMSYLKLDVFVTDKPISETLENVARTLDAEWTRGRDGWTLAWDKKKRREEEDYLKKEEELAFQKANREIEILRRMGEIIPPSDELRVPRSALDYISKNETNAGILSVGGEDYRPFEYLVPELLRAERSLQGAKTSNKDQTTIDRLEVEVQAYRNLVRSIPKLTLARLISQLTENDLKSFRSGIPFAISNLSGSRFQMSTGDRVNSMVSYRNGKVLSPSVLGLARIVPDTFDLSYVEYSYAEGSSGIATGSIDDYPFSTVPDDLQSHPFVQRLKTFDQSRDLAKLFPQHLLLKPGLGWKPEFFVRAYRFGDHLRWFHRASGIPVVAIADRVASKTFRLENPSPTVSEYANIALRPDGAYLRKEGDFLLAKSGVFWRKTRNEIPESLYATIEGLKRKPSLAEYGRFSTQISETQGRMLSNYSGFLSKVSTRLFNQSFNALKLYGMFTASQISQCEKGVGIVFENMSAQQQNQFRYMIIESLMTGAGSCSQEFLIRMVKTGLSPDAFRGTSFGLDLNHKPTMSFGSVMTGSNNNLTIADELNLEQNDPPTPTFRVWDQGKSVLSFLVVDR